MCVLGAYYAPQNSFYGSDRRAFWLYWYCPCRTSSDRNGIQFGVGKARRKAFASVGACVVGANMRLFPLNTALALYLSVLPATAADRYGEWLLEQPRSAVFTLSFKQSVPRNSKIATSELGFICDQKDQSALVGAILIPADGTFENRQRIIPVLI